MRKPEVDMPTEWAKHLRSGRKGSRNKHGKRNGGMKRIYYHSLRQRLKKDLRKREE